MEKVERKYLNDPEFRALVDWMVNAILKYQYDTSEMRQAAMLACVIAERNRSQESKIIFDLGRIKKYPKCNER